MLHESDAVLMLSMMIPALACTTPTEGDHFMVGNAMINMTLKINFQSLSSVLLLSYRYSVWPDDFTEAENDLSYNRRRSEVCVDVRPFQARNSILSAR